MMKMIDHWLWTILLFVVIVAGLEFCVMRQERLDFKYPAIENYPWHPKQGK